MTDHTSTDHTLFARIKDEAARPDPYPLFAALRECPVSRQEDGTYVAASHAAITSLLHDPRVSSETLPPANRPKSGNPLKDWLVKPVRDHITNTHRPFIFRDPPDHDTLRAAVMHQVTHQRVQAMRARSHVLVDEILDKLGDARTIDIVDDLAYPLPVTIICELLGVPPEDEEKFHAWATQLATALEPDNLQDDEARAENIRTFDVISEYMQGLIAQKRKDPQDDMLTGLATEGAEGAARMSDFDLIATAILMLVAGHETTVNLITNGMLTLLRHPEELRRLREDPDRAPRVVEELLRYEPPVQFRTRKALCPIRHGDVTIPEGAPLVLMLAAGNRDPEVYAEPERFDPDRTDNRHLGFGGGLHYCVGAPLARFEVEAALVALARRLKNPRLLADPPPYRPGSALRGPKHLRIAIDGIDP